LDAKIEVIAEGFDWVEGPVWIKEGGIILFSEIPSNTIMKWKEGEGASVFLHPSGYTGTAKRGGEVGSNALRLDMQGRMLLCQHGDRRVARLDSSLNDPKPNYVTLADNYHGKKFNSPNDLVVHSNVYIYFTDPAYGLEFKMDDPAKELDFQGVYRIAKDGGVTLLTKEMTRPNGIALSPDEKTLYVANSDPDMAVWKAFNVKEDGNIENGRVFLDVTKMAETKPGLPDGMKVDQHGNLFASGPGGIFIITPQGKHLGTIVTGQHTSNCAFGDDGKTLYMTADDYIMRIKINTAGIGF
jgi:gluconolactonase